MVSHQRLITSLEDREERRIGFKALPFALFHLIIYSVALFNHFDMTRIHEAQTALRGTLMAASTDQLRGARLGPRRMVTFTIIWPCIRNTRFIYLFFKLLSWPRVCLLP